MAANFAITITAAAVMAVTGVKTASPKEFRRNCKSGEILSPDGMVCFFLKYVAVDLHLYLLSSFSDIFYEWERHLDLPET
tara:strand:+ start:1147 stop:1386 length:240 start_codon:yes stop_codon:yes gene_type:complete